MRALPSNVIPFPPPPAKTVAVASAGPYTFQVLAATDILRETDIETTYREELVAVDPDAELEDDCLVVMQFERGRPHMARWWRTGRDGRGRFLPSDDPREHAMLHFGLTYPWRREQPTCLRILGRVVGEPRRL